MKMKSKTPKFIALALITAILAPVLLSAGTADAKDRLGGHWTNQHKWIAFGRYDGKPIIWRILETGETDKGKPTAFLLAEDAVTEMSFDTYSNDWNDSDIKRWLNDDFYHAAFNKNERGAIVNSFYYYGGKYKGSDREAAFKVFLLSTDEAGNKKFFANDADRSTRDWWFLRSPGDTDVYAARRAPRSTPPPFSRK
jgi:hypothetical protein